MQFKVLVGGALLAPFIFAPSAWSAHHEEAAAEVAGANPDCQLTIEASDTMQYNTLEMSAPASCEEVTVTLVHTGRLPKEGMMWQTQGCERVLAIIISLQVMQE